MNMLSHSIRITNPLIILAMIFLQGCGTPEPIQSTLAHLIRGPVTSWNFDAAAKTALRGWRFAETHSEGTPGTWAIVRQNDAPSLPGVLKLVETKNENGTFNLATSQDVNLADLDLTVAVYPDQGEEDQGGGPIWRYQDAKNYYVCRMNPLESNFRLYRVVRGKRKKLKSAEVDLEAGHWYTVRVTMMGSNITCYLDGKKLLQASDNTISHPGGVGLWTKSDAVTAFDDLTVTALKNADKL